MLGAYDQIISEENRNFVLRISTYNSYERTRKMAWILFGASLILFYMDYANWVKGLWDSIPGFKWLFYTHVALGLVTLSYGLASLTHKTGSPEEISLFHQWYVLSFAIFILLIAAVVSGWVDQAIHGHITIYIIACFTIAIVSCVKPKLSVLIYLASYIVFMLLLTVSHSDPVVREGHYINGSLLVVIACFLANILYKLMQSDLLHRYKLEALVSERTKELQESNELLIREINERKSMEAEMARLDRLNLIGQMAASISHEVRNPMTTVKGFLQFLRKHQDAKGQEYFDLMVAELDRANSILTEFLSINRAKATVFEQFNLNDIIKSLFPLIQAEALKGEVFLVVELNPIPDFKLNVPEIRQLILNLVRNAFEAMPDGGELRLRTVATEHEVVLAVQDQGGGIEQYILERLGTPFLTTKDTGAGLGLAVCDGIISRHGGRLSVETNPEGSTFSVFFKLASGHEAELSA